MQGRKIKPSRHTYTVSGIRGTGNHKTIALVYTVSGIRETGNHIKTLSLVYTVSGTRGTGNHTKHCPWLTLYLASEEQGIIKPLSLAYTVSGIRGTSTVKVLYCMSSLYGIRVAVLWRQKPMGQLCTRRKLAPLSHMDRKTPNPSPPIS